MGRTQALTGGLVAALMVTVVLAGLARATPSSGTSSSLIGPPATFGPFNAKGTDVAMEEMVIAYERLEMEA